MELQIFFMKKSSILLLGFVLAFISPIFSQVQLKAKKLNVAILIFNGVQIIDYTGPYEVFGQIYPRNVYTVAEKADTITTTMGMKVFPSYTINNSPKTDILIIPGGKVGEHKNNPNIIKWIQDNSSHALYVLGVCNGAYFLAKAGLLDGLEATTTASLLPDFKEYAPKTKVIGNKRFVDNGKVITSGGLSAGIDASLHIISKIHGVIRAASLARGLEYNWDPEGKYVRGALADMLFQNAWMYTIMTLPTETLKDEGDTERWELILKTRSTSIDSVSNLFEGNLETKDKWQKQTQNKKSEHTKWNIVDEQGRRWEGQTQIKPSANEIDTFIINISINRNEK